MYKKAITTALFPIGIEVLANHLGKGTSTDSAILILKNNPFEAELLVERLLKSYFWAIKAELTISSLKFSHLYLENTPHAIAYFEFRVTGTRAEISKVFGEGKMIFTARGKAHKSLLT